MEFLLQEEIVVEIVVEENYEPNLADVTFMGCEKRLSKFHEKLIFLHAILKFFPQTPVI